MWLTCKVSGGVPEEKVDLQRNSVLEPEVHSFYREIEEYTHIPHYSDVWQPEEKDHLSADELDLIQNLRRVPRY